MTLTQAAVFTKKGVVIFIGLVILAGIFKLLFDFGSNLYLQYNPPPEAEPDLKFGKLPRINYPASKSSSNYTYSLDTKTGNLPQNPKMIKIYFIPQAGVSLLSSERSKQLAEKLEFTGQSEVISATQIRVKNQADSSVVIDLPTGNLTFDRTKEIPTDNQVEGLLPTPEDLVSDFRGYLGGAGLMKPQITSGRSNVVYSGPSRAESDRATVSIWPNNLDELSYVTPDYNHGLIKAVVTKHGQVRYAKLDYYFWQIDESSFATYPLRSVQQAYEELKGGNAYISIEPPAKQVSITDVSLGYYQSQDYTPYLQPVYVFSGPNFAAYVTAVDASQIQ